MRIIALEVEIDDGRIVPNAGLATAEAARLWELVQAGVVRETYFRLDRRAAVLVLECADLDEARLHLGTLPFVREGLITFELIGLRPYPGFARLFADRTAAPVR
jgi:hypothetical protein